ALAALAADVPRSKLVMPHRPAPDQLRNLHVPTLVLVAEKTRSQDPTRVTANARALLPQAVTGVLPGATHHTIPIGRAADLNDQLTHFLAADTKLVGAAANPRRADAAADPAHDGGGG